MTGNAELKAQVREYWDARTCGTDVASAPRFTRAYFDEVEEYRYRTESEIFAFAQFTRHRGERVLEVGVGAGTDFLQWVRAGAVAHGVDLTPAAIDHVRHRLEVYGLEAADIRVADAEALPFDDDSFDLVYSWGVIHHSPDTERALREIIRVTRPGGRCRIMIYNRRSLTGVLMWIRYALFRGRPFRSIAWCLHHHYESIGTKAWTPAEVRAMLAPLPVSEPRIHTILTHHEQHQFDDYPIRRAISRVITAALGGRDRAGWYMTIEFTVDG